MATSSLRSPAGLVVRAVQVGRAVLAALVELAAPVELVAPVELAAPGGPVAARAAAKAADAETTSLTVSAYALRKEQTEGLFDAPSVVGSVCDSRARDRELRRIQ
jgi:hypothetical protein